MKLVVQVVKNASVTVDDKIVSKINRGFMVLIGITPTDSKDTVDYMVKKLVNLRVFEDEEGKLNKSLKDVCGELLLVSQFTLYGDTSKGNRPSFINAAKGEIAEPLYNYFVSECKKEIDVVGTGVFGANMQVSLINDGPTTIIIEK